MYSMHNCISTSAWLHCMIVAGHDVVLAGQTLAWQRLNTIFFLVIVVLLYLLLKSLFDKRSFKCMYMSSLI